MYTTLNLLIPSFLKLPVPEIEHLATPLLSVIAEQSNVLDPLIEKCNLSARVGIPDDVSRADIVSFQPRPCATTAGVATTRVPDRVITSVTTEDCEPPNEILEGAKTEITV
jgi:hypothetical protein